MSIQALFISHIIVASAILPSTPAHATDCNPTSSTSGMYTTVIFTFVGTCTWQTPLASAMYRGLVVGGGGGGGKDIGGGGGGGGYLAFSALPIGNGTLNITVGGGGAGATGAMGSGAGSSGGSSSIAGDGLSLISLGGAGGASWTIFGSAMPARTGGGSGGGGGGGVLYPSFGASAGNQLSQIQIPDLSSISGVQYGSNGGAAGTGNTAGGGGGAGSNGSRNPGDGGAGRFNNIVGIDYYWAAGGGGGASGATPGRGGVGGGGGGGGASNSVPGPVGGVGLNSGQDGYGSNTLTTNTGGAGGANTGGGGGGGAFSMGGGGDGGSGIVVLRYFPYYGAASVDLTHRNGATTISFGRATEISAAVGTPGLVTFFAAGKVISKCKNLSTVGSFPSIVATCTWKPHARGIVGIVASITPYSPMYGNNQSTPLNLSVVRRTTLR